MKLLRLMLLAFLLFCTTGLQAKSVFNTADWWAPFVGYNVGNYELSVGSHFWNDHLTLRNLQLRAFTYLSPGIRGNMVLRSNRDMAGLENFQPNFDELFLEGVSFYQEADFEASASLRAGRIRYLRFPYPDIIAMYDQVPGIEDLLNKDVETGYEGAILSTEIFHHLGVGYHFTGMYGTAARLPGFRALESYAFLRKNWGLLNLETRYGYLQVRNQYLGASDLGVNVHVGVELFGYKVGCFYEAIKDQPISTGVLVEFAPSEVTNFMGKYHFDYTRSPTGFALQIPLLTGIWGITETVPTNAVLVGSIQAERTITYWQNGQGRNFYEHIISKTGETDAKDLIVVLKQQPWYLRIESLVSPYNKFQSWEDLRMWESKRQGPAQMAQRVEYQFYKK